MIDAKRPQDLSRSPGRRAKGRPSAETQALLGDYQHMMRVELRRLLADIRGKSHGNKRAENVTDLLPIGDREKRWKLAISLARELGAEIDGPVQELEPAIGFTVVPRGTAEIDFD